MKKRLLYAASVAAIALTACTSEEYLGGVESQGANTVIGFSSETKSVTRAQATGSSAAEKLNNNFVVYGFKTNYDATTTAPASGAVNQMVFNHYNVNYEAGTAYTTESNTAGWEYVGLANHDGSINPQTIKYWDHSAKSYVFSAVSGTGITAQKITNEDNIFDNGWTVNIPAGGSLADLYASDLKVVAPADYNKQVDLTFRALVSKIRFAIYETVPGYEVKIDRFWTGDDTTPFSKTNFEIKGNFKTAKASAATPLKVTYYNSGDVKYRPKVTFDAGDVASNAYGEFGANIQAQTKIGTTSAEATYDQTGKAYTMILPYESLLETDSEGNPVQNVLKLKVNYTLTSTDGSGETIKVYGATAYVPTQYTQWKPNYAYTYIFKISDKTNGTTKTPTDEDDPNDDAYKDPDTPGYDPNDPTIGLSPITFDAVVITDETDVQETITTVAEPSITTYAKGVIVTKNDEYTPGDIYVTVMKGGKLMNDLNTNAKIYEVKNNGTETLSEAVTENYLKNYCTLTPVTATIVTDVPRTDDGTNITFGSNEAMKFTAEAGKIYAVEYAYDGKAYTVADYNAATGSSLTQKEFDAFLAGDDSSVKEHKYVEVTRKAYKIIKITGSDSSAAYSLIDAASTAITTVGGTHTLTLKKGSDAVLGAAPNFVITSDNGNKALEIAPAADAGNYTVSVNKAAIDAGKANGTYTVTVNGQSVTITVNIDYSLTPVSVNIVAGNATGMTTVLKIAGAAADGDVTEVPAGITVENTATGTYKVTAAENVTPGTYSAKIANKELEIIVDGYSFADLIITNSKDGGSTGTLTLLKNGTAITGDAASPALTFSTGYDALATVTAGINGAYTVTTKTLVEDPTHASGTFYVYYENAKAKVTINSYAISLTDMEGNVTATVAKSTGVANITVKCGSTNTINALTANLKLDSKPSVDAVYTLTTNGKSIQFSDASVAGTYKFHYEVDGVNVAEVSIEVL